MILILIHLKRGINSSPDATHISKFLNVRLVAPKPCFCRVCSSFCLLLPVAPFPSVPLLVLRALFASSLCPCRFLRRRWCFFRRGLEIRRRPSRWCRRRFRICVLLDSERYRVEVEAGCLLVKWQRVNHAPRTTLLFHAFELVFACLSKFFV